MLDDLLFLSSAMCVATFITAGMFRFTHPLGNWMAIISLVATVVIILAILIVDHKIVDKLQVWWS